MTLYTCTTCHRINAPKPPESQLLLCWTCGGAVVVVSDEVPFENYANMRRLAYTGLKELGFTEIVENRKENKRLGILKSFEFGNLYAEVIPRDWGLSIQIAGGQFQEGYYPANYDACTKADLAEVFEQIKLKL